MVNSNTFSSYCLFKYLTFPNYILSNLTFMLEKEIGELCKALYAKILCLRIRHVECALKISILHHIYFNEDRKHANLCHICLHALALRRFAWLNNILFY